MGKPFENILEGFSESLPAAICGRICEGISVGINFWKDPRKKNLEILPKEFL